MSHSFFYVPQTCAFRPATTTCAKRKKKLVLNVSELLRPFSGTSRLPCVIIYLCNSGFRAALVFGASVVAEVVRACMRPTAATEVWCCRCCCTRNKQTPTPSQVLVSFLPLLCPLTSAGCRHEPFQPPNRNSFTFPDSRNPFLVVFLFFAVFSSPCFLAGTKDRIRKADMDMAQLKANAVASSGRGVGRPIPSQMRR